MSFNAEVSSKLITHISGSNFDLYSKSYVTMDQVSPVGNLLIESVESCSWNSSPPRQSPVCVNSSIAPYSEDDSHHRVVNVESAYSESGGSFCDALTPGRSLDSEQPEDILSSEYEENHTSSYENNSTAINEGEARPVSLNQPQIKISNSEAVAQGLNFNPISSLTSVEPGKKDPRIHVSLEGGELWRQFLQVGTEMIITRSGRRMFPGICVSVCGLDPDAKYTMYLEMNPADNHRYKFINTKWVIVGKSEAHSEELLKYVHPDAPATGRHWMSSKVSFKKIKVTNNKNNKKGQVSLNSMHRYLPRIVISKCISKKNSVVIHTHDLDECCFIAVTAYQNDQVTQLKIDHNPFAKAFRDNPTESDMYGYGMMGTWPPISPLLSPYGNSYSMDMQAMQQSMLSPSMQPPGPSPLPQFNTAFGNWESPPYSPAAMYKPHLPSSGGALPSPAFPESHRQMLWNASKLTHDSPPISPLVYPSSGHAASHTLQAQTALNPSVYQFPNVSSVTGNHLNQDESKSLSYVSSRYQPWLKSQTPTAPTYLVSGSPVGYGPVLGSSSNPLSSHSHTSAFVPPKQEPVASPLCSTSNGMD